MPREPELRDLQIYVDRQRETLILPLFGCPVPFHIATVKVRIASLLLRCVSVLLVT